jgi:ParB family chromosome partitioning protein
MGVSKNLLTPSVMDAVVTKINQKRITNSKDIRKLRTILRDPVAKANFMSDEGDIDSAILRIESLQPKRQPGLLTELDAAMDAIRNTPWTALEELKGDANVLEKLDQTEALLQTLRKNLKSQ